MANTVDSPQSNLDRSVRVFDKFYNFDMNINSNEYDIVYSYYYEKTKSEDVAKNFAVMIFRISSITGEYSLDILEYVKSSSKTESNALLAYYLNGLKSKTTLYGVSSNPQPNQNVQRNIVI